MSDSMRCSKCETVNPPNAKCCNRCAAPLAGGPTSPQVPGSGPETEAKGFGRVGVAILLSLLFPGFGQIYNGQVAKAMAIPLGWLAVQAVADRRLLSLGEFPPVGKFLVQRAGQLLDLRVPVEKPLGLCDP
jgi:hypothetical protein